jgi:uncharacterized phage protein (TIGR02218 family)
VPQQISIPLQQLFNACVSNAAALNDFDLYSIALAGGGALRYTTADFDILASVFYNGAMQGPYLFKSFPIDVKDNKVLFHQKVGLDSDNWTVMVVPRPVDLVTGAAFPDRIGGLPWLMAADGGALDSADVQVDRAYFAGVPTWPMPTAGAAPVGTKTIFAGVMAEVDVVPNLFAALTINDYRSLMQLSMPREFYQGQCRFTLFDSGCNASGNMNQASFAQNATCIAGSTPAVLVAPALPVPGGSRTYSLGKLQMTSGNNSGFWRTVKQWDGASQLQLLNPLPFAVTPGDTFTVTPGCDKRFSTCQAFQPSTAIDNFGGQPFIPAPETAT